MATSYDELKSFLHEGGFRHRQAEDDTLLTGFGEMEYYRDPDGVPRLGILLKLHEAGSVLEILCPRLYAYRGPQLDDLLRSCMLINYWVRLIAYDYDDRDGELRASIILVLEDAPLTAPQLARCLTTLAHQVDRCDPFLQRTMLIGGVHVPRGRIGTGA